MGNIGIKKIYSYGIKLSAIILVLLSMTGCGKKYVESEALKVMSNDFDALDKRQVSLENRDYVIYLTIDEVAGGDANIQKKYMLTFEVADLTEYSGDRGKFQKTEEYSFNTDSLEEALNAYFEENERQLDMGHISGIYINDSIREIKSNELVYEMSMLPSIAKSVQTTLISGGNTKELILRELIKNVYAGEDF